MVRNRDETQIKGPSILSRRRRKDHRPGSDAKPLRFEPLEQRALLSVTPIVPKTLADSSDPAKGSLRDAIIAANASPGTDPITIQLKAGTYTLSLANKSGHEAQSATGDLNITSTAHQLTIQGAGKLGAPTTIIRQTAADRVFEIAGPDVQVVFKNLIIQGGSATDGGEDIGLPDDQPRGGGILNNGGNISLLNVIIRSNKASVPANASIDDAINDAQGGGIFSQDGKLTLDTVTFSSNTVTGGQNSQGGGLYAAETDVSMTKVTFSKSTAQGIVAGQGGGLYFDNSSPDVKLALSTVTFSSNTAAGANGQNGRVIVSGSSTTAIEATEGGSGQGGGIYLNSGAATLSKVTFSANTAKGGNGGIGASARGAGDGSPGANGGAGQGGGMLINDGLANLSEVTFSKNIAQGGTGGKGGNAAKMNPSAANSWMGMGGIGANGGDGGDGQGGGLYNGGGLITLSKTTFSSNTAQGANGGNGGNGAAIRTSSGGYSGGTAGGGGNGGSGQGGGMYVGAGTVTLDLGSLSKNVVKKGLAGKKGSGFAPEETGDAGTADGAGIALCLDADFSSTNTTFPTGQGPVNLDG